MLTAVLLTVAAVYAPTVNDYFGGDDFLVIGPVRNMGAWEIIWKAVILQDNIVYWRPLVTPIYSLEVHGFGLTPWAYHAIALGLHLVNVALLVGVATALTGRRGVGLAAALLFGVHAAHTTTVAQISSTVELFSVVWYFATMLGAVRYARGHGRRWYWLALIAFALALLTKESTASAAGVTTVLFGLVALAGTALPAHRPAPAGPGSWGESVHHPSGQRLRRLALDLAPFWALVIPYIAFTYITDTDDPTGITSAMYHPGAHIGQNLWWFAARLAAPFEVGQGPHVSVAGHAGAAVLLVAAVWLLARGPLVARFLVLWTVIALMPLALWRPELLLGRFTYQASAPFAILLALGGAWLADRLTARLSAGLTNWAWLRTAPVTGLVLALAALALYAPLTLSQNRDRTREGEQYRVLVTSLQRLYPAVPPGSEIELLDGIWSGPFHALYLDAVADTLYGAGNVRLVNVDAGAAQPAAAAHVLLLRYDGAQLHPAESP